MKFLRNLLRSDRPAPSICVPPSSGGTRARPRRALVVNDLAKYAGILASIQPWRGRVPSGFVVDYLGNVTPKEFFEPWGHHPAFVDGAELDLPIPKLGTGEAGEDFWFESLNWILVAREARVHFVMLTLGALHGYQAVGCCQALQRFNPMPYKLVAVEPIPDNVERIRRQMRENGIDPDAQWIIQAAVSDTNAPALFPVGAPGAGWQNCMSTDEHAVRASYLNSFIQEGRVEDALRNLLLHNSTGLRHKRANDDGMQTEIRLVSCVTLADLLAPFERIDYIEADMQESEIRAFPAYMDLLRRKVRRIHIATHGARVHAELHEKFAVNGWDIVFSYAPDGAHPTPWGTFVTNDGVLTVLNPALER